MLSKRLSEVFTEHLLSFLFAASSCPRFIRQLPIDHSPNTYYVRAHQADQWHRRAHYFYEYQTRRRMKMCLSTKRFAIIY